MILLATTCDFLFRRVDYRPVQADLQQKVPNFTIVVMIFVICIGFGSFMVLLVFWPPFLQLSF